MKQPFAFFACFVILSLPCCVAGQNKTDPSLPPYVPVTIYDPNRNAETDIKDAVLEARRTGKRVLVDVGGEWCVWCHTLDKFFVENPKLLEYREQNYVMVKINFSPENKNARVLSRYPAIPGFPHLFVLDTKGRLLRSQGTGELEAGKSYNAERVFRFLRKWAVQK
jgi:thioredoxin-related protein